MKIHSIRLGHATNSSSTHSIIIWRGEPQEDSQRLRDSFEYGWDKFTLASPEEKAKYLAAQLFDILQGHIPEDVRRAVVKDITGIGIPQCSTEEPPYDHPTDIDHQSRFGNLPSEPGKGRNVNTQFYREFFKSACEDDEVLILGGNDNGERHPLLRDRMAEPGEPNDDAIMHPMHNILFHHMDGEDMVARKDPIHNFWTLFSQSSGTKLRIDFSNMGTKITKSSVPELIDVKITDKCLKGCPFCYQNSSPIGEHALFDNISAVIGNAAELGVLELAFGGGEPTLHPQFPEILEVTNSTYGINANFSTGSTDWFDNAEIYQAVNDHCTAFAVSITSLREMQNLVKKAQLSWTRPLRGHKHKFHDTHIGIHIPMGVMDKTEFHEVIRLARDLGIVVTLLGFKQAGRGGAFLKHTADYINDDSFWNTVWSSSGYHALTSIDTLLAQQWSDRLRDTAAHESYDLQEGCYSCYVDCINLTLAIHSYATDAEAYQLSYLSNACRTEDLVSYTMQKAFLRMQDDNKM